MATYALTVSTNALGLGVINGATVRIEKRRIAIADTYPPINNLIQISQATNSSGIATFNLSKMPRIFRQPLAVRLIVMSKNAYA